MADASTFLNEGFFQFSEDMKKLHDQINAKKAELKKFYEQIQADIAGLEAEAATLVSNWEASQSAVE